MQIGRLAFRTIGSRIFSVKRGSSRSSQTTGHHRRELGSWKISLGSAYQCIQSHVLLKDFRLNEALSRQRQAEAWPQQWMARCSHEFQTRAGSNTHLDLIKCKTCGVELLRCLHNKVNFCELEKCMGTREACRVIENPTAHGLKTSSQESSEPVRQTYTPTLGEKARARDKMRGQVPHNILTMQAFQNMTDSMSDTDADAFIQFLAEERQKARGGADRRGSGKMGSWQDEVLARSGTGKGYR